MTFFVQGLTRNELLPMVEVFKKPLVEKTTEIVAEHAIDETKPHTTFGHDAVQAYQSVKQLPQTKSVVLAEQIMCSPVVMLEPQSTVDQAVILLRSRQIRHLPVVSAERLLVGIVSERDVLHHLGGVEDNYQLRSQRDKGESVAQLMKSPVLTASKDTDVRYIARLFVEQRVGALPIVTDGELVGIITRSDVLNAVMRHFVLELWV